jgi:hypothetical protein
MAYGVPGKSSMPEGRKPIGYDTNVTGSNPDVHSKGARNGAYEAASDPRNLKGELYKSDVPASLPARDVTAFKTPAPEKVGFLGDGRAAVAPKFAMGKASAGIDHASTAGAKGMADKA